MKRRRTNIFSDIVFAVAIGLKLLLGLACLLFLLGMVGWGVWRLVT